MRAYSTALPEVVVFEPTVFADDRGWFMETFHEGRFQDALSSLGLPRARPFVQDNQSCSKAYVLRGLHYQLPPHAQGKLVRAVVGRIFDVAVDVRRASTTFGRWVGVELSAENRRQLWVPEGFAHGFLALDAENHVLYKTTGLYNRDSESGVLWNDPAVGIEWPLPAGQMPVITPKDEALATLQAAVTF